MSRETQMHYVCECGAPMQENRGNEHCADLECSRGLAACVFIANEEEFGEDGHLLEEFRRA
jgi:hypothetical protein